MGMIIPYIMENTGRWLSHPSEKYEFVSWDHYSQAMESHNPVMFQTPNQIFH